MNRIVITAAALALTATGALAYGTKTIDAIEAVQASRIEQGRLTGQLTKNGPEKFGEALSGALPLLIAVVIGGQLGSLLAIRFLPEKVIRWLTAALTIWAGSQLLLK